MCCSTARVILGQILAWSADFATLDVQRWLLVESSADFVNVGPTLAIIGDFVKLRKNYLLWYV